ncbi:adenylate/guanylate cyclase domain-containing protein [Roseivirga sp.]|uniref:adenylate/guanylate cyclase domain-containing protein n=1 Tax=Roseivirga sp. TaxID=1964215 RepID=UPI003B519F1D
MKFHKTSQLKRRKKKIIGQYALFWPPALVFLTIIRSVGTIEVGSFDPGLLPSILLAAVFGFIGGVISGYFQFMLEEKIYGRTSIRKLALAKAIFIVIFLVTLIVIAYIMTRVIFHHDIDFITFAFDEGSAPVYLYIISVDIFMTRLRQVNLMLGEGNLTKLLAGKLYTPHEEERIFMFLDLQSSTTLAETLGHIKYSQMIQDCFFDLGVTNAYRAEIYQYVGDEAVLTWPLQEGLNRDNCLKAYYDFMDTLESKREYYQNKYGSLPFFKAALNCGTVTATEVGRYKREIAYHGDTLNTAARILAKCNEFNEEMLISESLRQMINTSDFEFKPMGEVPLRGKKEAVPIFAVKRKS